MEKRKKGGGYRVSRAYLGTFLVDIVRGGGFERVDHEIKGVHAPF